MADPIANNLGDKIFGIHADAMRVHSRRMELIASNLANADTPGFRAQALDFEKALAEMVNAESNPGQAPDVSVASDANTPIGQNHVNFRTAIQPSLDGNTVDVPQEQADFADASLRYQASMRMVEGRMRSLLAALRPE